MRKMIMAVGFATGLATLTAALVACGPDDRYDNPGVGADRGVGAGAGVGTSTTVPRAQPMP